MEWGVGVGLGRISDAGSPTSACGCAPRIAGRQVGVRRVSAAHTQSRARSLSAARVWLPDRMPLTLFPTHLLLAIASTQVDAWNHAGACLQGWKCLFQPLSVRRMGTAAPVFLLSICPAPAAVPPPSSPTPALRAAGLLLLPALPARRLQLPSASTRSRDRQGGRRVRNTTSGRWLGCPCPTLPSILRRCLWHPVFGLALPCCARLLAACLPLDPCPPTFPTHPPKHARACTHAHSVTSNGVLPPRATARHECASTPCATAV